MADDTITESMEEHDTFVSIDVYQQSQTELPSALNEHTETDLHTVDEEEDWNASEYEPPASETIHEHSVTDTAAFIWGLADSSELPEAQEADANSDELEQICHDETETPRPLRQVYRGSEPSSGAHMSSLYVSYDSVSADNRSSHARNSAPVPGYARHSPLPSPPGRWSVPVDDDLLSQGTLYESGTGTEHYQLEEESPLPSSEIQYDLQRFRQSSVQQPENLPDSFIVHRNPELSDDEAGRRELDSASRGITSYEFDNPFRTLDNEEVTKVVLLSKSGDLTSEERHTLRNIAANPNTPEAKFIKRLIQTISFQEEQLRIEREAEVHLADEMLEKERRRFSAADLERSAACYTLIEEVDKERQYALELEEQNNGLVEELERLRAERKEIHNFFSRYDPEFELSQGVSDSLSAAVNHINEFRVENEQAVADFENRIASYVERLTKTEALLAENRQRYDELLYENEQLRRLGPSEKQYHSPQGASPRRASVPSNNVDKERIDLLRRVEEQEYQLGDLRAAQQDFERAKERNSKLILRLNVEIQDAHKENVDLRKQRDEADMKHRGAKEAAKSHNDKFLKYSAEMTSNMQAAAHALDQSENEVAQLRSQLEDQKTAFNVMKSTSQELENILKNATEDIVIKSKNGRELSSEAPRHALVEAITTSIREELSRAQALLVERGAETDKLRKELQERNLALSALRGECTRLRSLEYINRRSSVSRRVSNSHLADEQQAFLRRLSEKLGCKPSNEKQVVEQLSARIELLLARSQKSEQACEELRMEIEERESRVKKIKAELEADIATLKAENAGLENARHIAEKEREVFEEKYSELIHQRDVTRDSFGDLTISSYGDHSSRRQSMFSNLDVENATSRWNDPLIEAAIHSLDSLIGRKEDFAARYRMLREKLEDLISDMAAADEVDNASRAILIESKAFQDEIYGMMSVQSGIIAKMRSGGEGSEGLHEQVRGEEDETEESSLPYINEVNIDVAQPIDVAQSGLSLQTNSATGEFRLQDKQTTGFLKKQFQHICGLYEDKLRANAQLCGIVQEQKVELDSLKSSHRDLEFTLSEQRDSYTSFLTRLAVLIGCEESAVSVEDGVNSIVRGQVNVMDSMTLMNGRQVQMVKRIANLTTQKAFLSKIIGLYQSKYKLDIFAVSAEQRANPLRRLRIMFRAALAATRILKPEQSSAAISEVSALDFYEVPRHTAIARGSPSSICLMDASMALSAIPRLEQAIVDRDDEICNLKESIAALSRSSNVLRETNNGVRSLKPSFAYNDELVNRKNDLSRKLRDVIAEREDLEKRLTREKQSRVAAEARVVKYVDRVSAMKKKLQRASSHAESKERTYKAAIRHLKEKADSATRAEVPGDENVDPLGERRQTGNEQITIPRGVLESYISRAETEMSKVGAGSGQHEELLYYVGQMRKAMRRVKEYNSESQSELVPIEA
ncbi:chromosome-associated kinesin KIF4A-like isoform X2 [Gracilaria domingensis]|nr:chromosome-associated kinesin KIF4A-like isoform X2 [Gracilaria domingensis]